MIKVILEKAVTETSIKKYESRVKKIHNGMEQFLNEGSDFLGWKNLPTNYNKKEFLKIKSEAKRLKKEGVELLVVIGIGGSYLGSKAGIDFIQGHTPSKRDMQVIFVGESISSTDLAQKLEYVDKKQFAINIISKSGGTTEPAIAFRLFKKLLEEKIGKTNAQKFIIATTDANNGSLLKQAIKNKWPRFIIPDSVGGRFSVLTPVGLFPMSCAGINIDKLMKGAKKGQGIYSINSIKNEAYKYAVARYILGKKYTSEMLISYEPQMHMFNEWWKQLYGESEGKMGKGLLPTSAIFSTDLHSMGQFIQEGSKVIFETVITIKEPNIDVKIIKNSKNLDNLNYLTEMTVHEVNTKAAESVLDAHVNVGKVPNIQIKIDKMDEKHLGQIFYFFEKACAMSSYLIGVNPFNQPGVEIYKTNMFKLLGKPGFISKNKKIKRINH